MGFYENVSGHALMPAAPAGLELFRKLGRHRQGLMPSGPWPRPFTGAAACGLILLLCHHKVRVCSAQVRSKARDRQLREAVPLLLPSHLPHSEISDASCFTFF